MSGTPEKQDESLSMKTARAIKVSGEVQLANHISKRYAHSGMPDGVYAEYTDGNGVKYAGTLYRVAPKEQG